MLQLKTISHFPIFSNFKKSELQVIIDNSFTKTLEKNKKLFAIHEKRDVFFIVLEGEIEIERELGASEEVVEIVTEGEYIAEHSLFNPKAMHSHTAKVHSKKAVVLGIPGKLFAKLPLKTAHKLLLNLLPIISDNFSHASNRMMTILKTGEILGQQTKDIGELGNAILKILLQAIKTNKALIALKITGEPQAQIRSLQGFKDSEKFLNKTINLEQDYILETIIEQGKMINIGEADYATGSKKIKYISSSVLGMPLEMFDQTTGAILLIDKKNNEDFNTNNEVLLKIVSKMVSLGIYQAGIYEYQEAQLELSREYISM